MKRYLYVLLFLLIFSIFPYSIVYADSDYVLPYPSFMPGNKVYKIHLLTEKIEKYWYFGNFGQFSYNLKLTDKYLVEAKTLFEYKQYLLGLEALEKSDSFFRKTLPFLILAKKEGKNINNKEKIFKSAALKHVETLHFIKQQLPENFNWQPEKKEAIQLNLYRAIENSIAIRKNI